MKGFINTHDTFMFMDSSWKHVDEHLNEHSNNKLKNDYIDEKKDKISVSPPQQHTQDNIINTNKRKDTNRICKCININNKMIIETFNETNYSILLTLDIVVLFIFIIIQIIIVGLLLLK